MPQRLSLGRAFALLVVCLLMGLGGSASALAQDDAPALRDRLIDLGALEGDDFSYANGINNKGMVVGESGDIETYLTRATVYYRKDLTLVDESIEFGSSAGDINEDGLIAGYAQLGEGGAHAVTWLDDEITDLGTLGGLESYALGLNNEGQVVGWSLIESDTFEQRAFLWSDGEMTDLGVLGDGTRSLARDINDRGQVVGSSTTRPEEAAPAPEYAFLWEDGEMTELPVIEGDYSAAVAINRDGVIVGVASTDDGDGITYGIGIHAAKWEDGEVTDLGTLGEGESSTASGINRDGMIVGSSLIEPGAASGRAGENHACVWTADGELYDLNDLIPEESGWILERATDINDRGQIVGTGLLDGQQRAFLLLPEGSEDDDAASPVADEAATPTEE